MIRYLNFLLFFLISGALFAQKNVGIGTEKPDPKAVLELKVENPSTNPQGLFLPRLTDAQGTLLGSMLNASHKGLSAYNTDDNTFYIWDGTKWKSAGNLVSIIGLGGITISAVGSNFSIDGTNIQSQWTTTGLNQIVYIGNTSVTGTVRAEKAIISSPSPEIIVGDNNINPAFQKQLILGYNVGGDYAQIQSIAQGIGFRNLIMGEAAATRIGIGTNSPNEKFTVQGNSSVTGTGYFSTLSGLSLNGAPVGSVVTVDGNGTLGFGAYPLNTSQWTTTGANIYFDNRVGIGTTLPSSNLDVIGTPGSTAFKVTPGASGFAGIDFTLNNTFFNVSGTRSSLGALTRISNSGTSDVLSVVNSGGGNAASFIGNVNIEGNSSASGIGYFGTIIGNDLTGASGSIVTVDGAGKLGLGTLPNIVSSQWINTTNGIYFTSLVGINGIAPQTGTGLNIKSVGNSTKPLRIEYSSTSFPMFELDQGSGGQGNVMFYDNAGVKVLQFGVATPSYFNGSNNFGIGTTTPNEKFTVQGNSSTSGIGYFGTIIGSNLSGAAGSIVTVDGLGKLGIGTLNIPQNQWITASSNQIYVNSFVGIGTNNPLYSLHVSSPNSRVAFFKTTNASDRTTAFEIQNQSGSAGWLIGVGGIGNAIGLSSEQLYFQNDIGAPRDFIILPNGGKVGIGTISPNQELSVNGNSSVSGIGYFGTIIGNDLTGAAGSIVTVDGLGKLGIGTLPTGISGSGTIGQLSYFSSSNTLASNSGLTYNNTNSILGLSGFSFFTKDGTNAYIMGGNGYQYANFTGSHNVLMGESIAEGYPPFSGSYNVVFGYQAAYGLGPASSNVIIGKGAGNQNYTGNNNIFIGENAGFENSSGGNNIIIGRNAGYYVGGTGNVLLGQNAGITGNGGGVNNNVIIGNGADVGSSSQSNSIAIGAFAVASGSNQMVFGSGITALGINTGAPTSMLDVNGGARIRNLSISGSVLTVDGSGNVGMGILPSATNDWTIVGNNIRPVNTLFNIAVASFSGAFMIQNTPALRMSSTGNLFLGNAGNSSSSGVGNILIGTGSTSISSSNGIIAIGQGAGASANGTFNSVFIGNNAGNASNASGNVFVGNNAGQLSTAFLNVAIGSDAGSAMTGGYDNVFLGPSAGNSVTNGHGNVLLGFSAGGNNSNGVRNIAIGRFAQFGSNNLTNAIVIGESATATGSNQAVIGNNITGLGINTNAPTAMLDVNGGARIRALSISGSVLTVDGAGNLGMGLFPTATNDWTIIGSNLQPTNELYGIVLGSTSGAYRIMNNNALRMNSNQSIYLGNSNFSNGGSNNIIFGQSTGNTNITGTRNNIMGQWTGSSLTTGSDNNFMGQDAGVSNTSGNYNNFFGTDAGQSNTTGSGNNFFGNYAGGTNLTGSNNIAIGSSANFGSSDLTNAIAIGTSATINQSYSMAIGANAGSANALTSVGISTNSPTAMLDVNGSIRVRNLSVTGSVLTVDGAGNIGMGTMASASQWTTTTNGISYTSGNVGIGAAPSAAFGIDMLKNMARIKRVSDAAGNNAEFDLSDNAETFTWRFGLRPSDQNNNFNIGYFSGSYFVRMYIDPATGNTGFGNFTGTPPVPNERVVVFGNHSTTGIGYFGTLIGNNMAGAPVGSVVTVDGTGRLGFGSVLSQSQWSNTTSGILYNGGNVAIGTSSNPTQGKLVIVEDAALNPGMFISGGGPAKSVNIQFGRTNLADGGIGIAGGVGSFSGIATTGDMVIRAETNNLILSAKNAGGDIRFSTGATDTEKMTILSNGNVGIGTSTPNVRFTVFGNSSVAGTSISNNLVINALANGILSVNGTGNVVTVSSASLRDNIWTSTSTGMSYSDDKVAIGTNTVTGTAKFKVAGDGSMGGMVLSSQSLVNPISTSNTSYATLISTLIYIPAGTSNLRANFIGHHSGGSAGSFRLKFDGIQIGSSVLTIGNAPAKLSGITSINVSSLAGTWVLLEVEAQSPAINESIVLSGFSVVVQD